MKVSYYKQLDGVRGCAALMVMVFHYMIGVNDNNNKMLIWLKKLSIFGQTGVILFFVLSGFLITRILLKNKNQPHYFRSFYIKRTLRIFPLYYLFLLIFYFIVPSIIHQAPNFHRSWMYWTYLQNFSETFEWQAWGPQHFWSLAVEEHFYLFWPLIVYFSSEKTLSKIAGFLIFLALICRIVLINLGYGTFYFTFTNIDCLALGALLAINETMIMVSFTSMRTIAIGSIILLLPTWFAMSGAHDDWIQIFKIPIIGLFYTGVIGCLTLKDVRLGSFLSSSAIRFTGKISYGLYVYHPIIFEILHYYLPSIGLLFDITTTFIASYIIATLSFYLFEVHFINLKKRFQLPTILKTVTSQTPVPEI